MYRETLQDDDNLAAVARSRFGVWPPKGLARRFASWVRQHNRIKNGAPSDAYCLMWLKCRLDELDYYEPFVRGQMFDGIATATLHAGFISIIETEEQLARLKWYGDEGYEPQVARSKIGSTPLRIQPINETSGRVTDWRTD